MNDFGTPAHHLHRREGPNTSIAGAHAVDAASLERTIYALVKAAGDEGLISTDLINSFPNTPHSITPRYSGLENKGYIYYLGDTRKGGYGRQQRVIRANRRKTNQLVMLERRIEPLLDTKDVTATPYRTPACNEHLPENDSDECPWCRIEQLEAALKVCHQGEE